MEPLGSDERLDNFEHEAPKAVELSKLKIVPNLAPRKRKDFMRQM